jgi:aryl-alcohol dehydrogenase-like predicted oxidoreductase
LERAKADGKLLDYGLSTHQRELALRALGEGWDPIMVRHSAAHRGAERAIFPQAQAVGARVLTFNNLCYGRLLRDPHQRGLVPPTPAECYRYALAQPGVSLCWSAPRDHDELLHNLQVLDEPALSEGRMEELRRFGDVVYEENRMFAECLRWK